MRYEFEKNQQTLSKLNDSKFKFGKMLTHQKGSNDSRSIGYNNAKHNYKSPTTFFKSAIKYRRVPSCFYCCKKGHLKFSCSYRRKDNYIIKNTLPFELCEHVNQIWVQKGIRPPNMVHPEYPPKFLTWSAN